MTLETNSKVVKSSSTTSCMGIGLYRDNDLAVFHTMGHLNVHSNYLHLSLSTFLQPSAAEYTAFHIYMYNQAEFDKATPTYNQDLKASGYQDEIHHIEENWAKVLYVARYTESHHRSHSF